MTQSDVTHEFRAREDERYAVLADAQAYAEALAGAIRKVFALAEEQIAALEAVERAPPQQLFRAQIERRLSEMLAATLLEVIAARGHKFGMLSWRGVPPEARGAWADIERAACEAALNTILNVNGESQHGERAAEEI